MIPDTFTADLFWTIAIVVGLVVLLLLGMALDTWLARRRRPKTPRAVIDELAHRRALRDSKRAYFDQHRIGRRHP